MGSSYSLEYSCYFSSLVVSVMRNILTKTGLVRLRLIECIAWFLRTQHFKLNPLQNTLYQSYFPEDKLY